jgi:hypothetical protein
VIGYAKPRGAARLPPAKTSIARVPGNEQTSLDDERGSLWRERGALAIGPHAEALLPAAMIEPDSNVLQPCLVQNGAVSIT